MPAALFLGKFHLTHDVGGVEANTWKNLRRADRARLLEEKVRGELRSPDFLRTISILLLTLTIFNVFSTRSTRSRFIRRTTIKSLPCRQRRRLQV